MAGPVRKPRARGAQPAEGAPRFTLRLSGHGATALGVVLLVAVCWSFFMGFMVGRGQNPEQHIGRMAGLNAQAPAPPEPTPAAPPSPPPAQEAAPPAEPATATAPEDPGAPSLDERAASYPFAKPSGSALTAWGIAPGAPTGGGAAPAPAARPLPQAQPDDPQFDFVYQVAAFRSTADAEALRARLEGQGIRSRREKNGKLSLVLVHLRGTDRDAAGLKETLAGLRLGAPILVSRKAVGKSKGRKKNR